MTRIERIRAALQQKLEAFAVEIIDDSHLHAGHAGARDGRGHYTVRVVARCFEGLQPLARHRVVYAALGDMMETDIHALVIEAVTPGEAG